MMLGKRKMSDEVIMEMLSNRYGWTPSQIREQRWQDIENYLDINLVEKKVEKYLKKKYGR